MRPLAEVLRLSTGYLAQRGVPTPRLDAELLIAHTLGLTRIELYTQHDRPLTEPELARIRALLERRGRREPIAYVLGEWGFRGLVLQLDARVLVPRPETEELVGRCLELIAGRPAPRVLDVGTGSGAVALAIKHECPQAQVAGADLSAGALEVARANGAQLELDVEWLEGDLLAAAAGRRFDLIVSNPPYVASSELGGLEPEVRDFEPRLATEAGPDGTEVLDRLVADAPAQLDAGGWLALECGAGQAAAVSARMAAAGYGHVESTADHAGIDRIVTGARP